MKHKYPVIFATFVLCLVATTVCALNNPTFIRGDVDNNGVVNSTDFDILVAYLGGGGQTPDCLLAADVNDDGVVDIQDPGALLNYVNDPEHVVLPPPFPECGVDPTDPALGGPSCCYIPPQIPSASPLGWVVLAFLLIGTSIWLIRKRRVATIRH